MLSIQNNLSIYSMKDVNLKRNVNTLKTRQEIAAQLSISVSTLKRYLERENIEIPKGRYLKPSEYQKIFELFECEP